MMRVSENHLKYIIPALSKKSQGIYSWYINKFAKDYDVTTPKRMAAFIANIAHESGQFNYTKEIWTNNKYQRNYDKTGAGNKYPGDGKRFMGRGLIQVTGRYNYQQFGKDVFNDPDKFLKNPELIEQPYYAVLSAFWFWKKNKLNRVADSNNFNKIVKIINGGYKGLTERTEYYQKALEALDPNTYTIN